jgi:hypothetical protein
MDSALEHRIERSTRGGQSAVTSQGVGIMRRYTLKAVANTLGVHHRTVRRHLASGEIPEAEKVAGHHGETWTIGDKGIAVLRDRLAVTVQAVPVIDLEPIHNDQADKTSSSSTTAGAELATIGTTATGIPWLDVRAMLEATEQRAAAERDHWQRLADSQGGIIAGLRDDLERERDETLRLRILLAEQAEQVVALSGQLAAFERFHSRSTTPISRAQLRALDGGQ